MEHKADISQSSPDKERILTGEFSVSDGKLSFTCHTQNVTFEEVLHGITLLRDELNRQIDNQAKCPFSPKHSTPVEYCPHYSRGALNPYTTHVVEGVEICDKCKKPIPPKP